MEDLDSGKAGTVLCSLEGFADRKETLADGDEKPLDTTGLIRLGGLGKTMVFGFGPIAVQLVVGHCVVGVVGEHFLLL